MTLAGLEPAIFGSEDNTLSIRPQGRAKCLEQIFYLVVVLPFHDIEALDASQFAYSDHHGVGCRLSACVLARSVCRHALRTFVEDHRRVWPNRR